MTIETVVFDVGGVFLDWNPRYLYRKVFSSEEQVEDFLGRVCTQTWNERQDAGRPFALGVRELQDMHPELGAEISAFNERWEEMIGSVFEDTVALLHEVKQAGHHIYALTNFSKEKFQIVRKRFSFFACFEGIVVSGEEGLIKPDPRLFHVLMDRYSIDPTNSVYIDDVAKNVDAATSLGFRGVFHRSTAETRKQLVALGALHGRS